MKNTVLIKKIFIFIFFFTYIVYSAGLFLRVGINSDYANLVLEASDIISGNPFLSGWNLTGISFYTTDILFFIIGTLIFGKSIYSYYAAVILMYALLFAGSMLLISEKSKLRWEDLLILLAVGGFPSVYACDVLRAHTAVHAYLFLSLICMSKVLSSDNNKKTVIYSVIYTLLVILGICGDSVMLVTLLVPVILYNILKFIFNRFDNIKKRLLICSLTISGAVLGKILDIILMSTGSTNKNTFLDGKVFMNFDGMRDKFRIYISSILGMTDSYFLGQPLLSINTLWFFLRLILVAVTFLVIIKTIVMFVKGKRHDEINTVLSIGFILMSVLFVITDIAADVFSARYIGYFPLLSAVLVIRDFKTYGYYDEWYIGKKFRFSAIAAIFAAVICVSRFQYVSFIPPEQPQDKLAVFLEENGLKNGYAKFWNASHVTVSSNDKVKVRAVIYDGNTHLAQFLWFCKDDWYKPEFANFIVIENGDENGDVFGITEASVKKSVGIPKRVLTFENYKIYVYSQNISDRIVYLGGQ